MLKLENKPGSRDSPRLADNLFGIESDTILNIDYTSRTWYLDDLHHFTQETKLLRVNWHLSEDVKLNDLYL